MGNVEIYCPYLTAANRIGGLDKFSSKCWLEQCGFWDKDREQCAFVTAMTQSPPQVIGDDNLKSLSLNMANRR